MITCFGDFSIKDIFELENKYNVSFDCEGAITNINFITKN